MILIISDYHKREDLVIDLIKKYTPTYTICCGDGESDLSFYEENNIISVKGNCDLPNLPHVKILEIEGRKILVTHGHLYNVHFDIFKLYLLAKENDCEYVLFGHTHIQMIEEYEGKTFINPGALKDGNYAIIDNWNIDLR